MNTDPQIEAVIIDDEQGARKTLKGLIDQYCPEVEIVGEADSIDMAIPLILKLDPDLIFLDIEMPKGSGFDLIEKIGQIRAKVVFTTAYSQYALKAIKASALDYLLKPIDLVELKASITKYQQFRAISEFERLSILRDQLKVGTKNIERIAIPNNEGFDVVNTKDIFYCEGEGNYTLIYLADKKTYMSSKPIKEYESILPEDNFIRVHQKHIVNLNYVKKYLKGRGGTIIMKDGKNISVSQNKRTELSKALLKY